MLYVIFTSFDMSGNSQLATFLNDGKHAQYTSLQACMVSVSRFSVGKDGKCMQARVGCY